MTDIRDMDILSDESYFERISRPKMGRRPWRFMSLCKLLVPQEFAPLLL
jgi:hypothetical protein